MIWGGGRKFSKWFFPREPFLHNFFSLACKSLQFFPSVRPLNLISWRRSSEFFSITNFFFDLIFPEEGLLRLTFSRGRPFEIYFFLGKAFWDLFFPGKGPPIFFPPGFPQIIHGRPLIPTKKVIGVRTGGARGPPNIQRGQNMRRPPIITAKSLWNHLFAMKIDCGQILTLSDHSLVYIWMFGLCCGPWSRGV